MTTRARRSRLATLLLLLGGLMLTVAIACGGEEEEATAVPTTPPEPTNTPVPTKAAEEPEAPATATPRPEPTATPTQAPAMEEGPSGDVVYGVWKIAPIAGLPIKATYGGFAAAGVRDIMFKFENGDPMTPELAESWEVSPDGSKVTFDVKTGIPWNAPFGFEELQDDLGELTVDDWVDWFNLGNATTNPDSTWGDAGDFAAIFLEAEKVDEDTLEVGLVSPVFFCLPVSEFGCLGAIPHVTNYTAGEELMSEDWAMSHLIGTGPFVQGECIEGDRCTVHAVDNHWRKTADIGTFTWIQVPEAQTRLSMVRTGQADAVQMDFKLIPGIVEDYASGASDIRFLQTMKGNFIGQSILYPGNLWEREHARTGEPLNPWDSRVYNEDHAWIGDPWQEETPDKVRYEDTNNPPGMTDMEQARLVRLALGTAIDREGISDNVLGGLGAPLYSEYMGPNYPGWDPGLDSGCWSYQGEEVSCSGTKQSVPLTLPDADQGEAGRLLDAAGFPLEGGKRDIEGLVLQKYPAEAGQVGLTIGDVVNATWDELGIEVSQLVEDYGTVISQRMRKREQFLPVLKNGDVNSSAWPVDWPYPPVDSSISRPGWGVGFESPALADWHFESRASRDRQKRIDIGKKTVDYMMFWQLYNGIYQIPRGIVVGPKIKAWDTVPVHYGNATGVNHPENLILAEE